MSDNFFKFNKELNKYFMGLSQDSKFELDSKSYNRFNCFLTIFDKNLNGVLDSDEIKNIWSKVMQKSVDRGGELIIDENSAESIMKELEKEGKLSGNELINFIKNLTASFSERFSSLHDYPYTYHENGIISKEIKDDTIYTFYPSGALEGIIDNNNSSKTYYANGTLASVMNADLSCTKYYSSGKIFMNLNSDRSYTAYFENGAVKAEQKSDGSFTSYYENGNIKEKRNTDNSYITYNSDGNVTARVSATGHDYTFYYNNGQIKESTEVPGYKYIEYYPNGQIKYELPEKGMAKVYDEQGNEIKEENKSLRFQLDVALESDPFDINAFKNILKSDNIDELLKLDIDSVTDDLEKNIKNPETLKAAKDYVQNIFKNIYNENMETFPKKSKIKNSNYEGSEYQIDWQDDKVYVQNLESNRKIVIDINNLTKNIPEEKRYILLIKLQNLPGEVLEDIADEAYFSDLSTGGNNGTYGSWTDTIQLLGGSFHQDTIVHELGHAIDNIFSELSYSTDKNNKLLTVYAEEKMTNMVQSDNNFNYAATNIQEFFAECYALLMLGDDYRAKECIETYFPKSFAVVKEMLKEIRQLAPEDRHRQDLK